jgi:hypothetical protein
VADVVALLLPMAGFADDPESCVDALGEDVLTARNTPVTYPLAYPPCLSSHLFSVSGFTSAPLVFNIMATEDMAHL